MLNVLTFILSISAVAAVTEVKLSSIATLSGPSDALCLQQMMLFGTPTNVPVVHTETTFSSEYDPFCNCMTNVTTTRIVSTTTQIVYNAPSLLPSVVPSIRPTTRLPTSLMPTSTFKPTRNPTFQPSVSISPSQEPTEAPTFTPTRKPSRAPSFGPTRKPSIQPTIVPTIVPTFVPTVVPTIVPTVVPTIVPTIIPTVVPTIVPTVVPTTAAPTVVPTIKPTVVPTITPTIKPTVVPTITPTIKPTVVPTTTTPTIVPTTTTPTIVPTIKPTIVPTITPTVVPTIQPTIVPTINPTITPTVVPTITPTALPSIVPTVTPTVVPTFNPTQPTIVPTKTPTVVPTRTPTVNPTVSRPPTVVPTSAPTTAYTHGMIRDLAGFAGQYGYSGNNSPATSARINQPGKATVDTSGNVYFHDTGNALLRKITLTTTKISIIVGKPFTTGAWDTAWEGFPGTSVLLTDNDPFECLFLDTNGVFYFSHTNSNRIMKLDTDMKVTTWLGNGGSTDAGDGSPATDSGMSMNAPWSFWFDTNGQTYIAGGGDTIRRVDASGIINTYAGSTYGFSGDGGPPLAATFKTAHRVHGDSVGNLFIRDHGNTRIRYVNPSGIVGTYIGNDNVGYNGENIPRTSAQLGSATSAGSYADMTVDDNTGDLLIADQLQFRLRSVSKTTGLVRTIAGTGARGNAGNNGRATSATLGGPSAIFYENGAGRVIFGDWYQLRVLY